MEAGGPAIVRRIDHVNVVVPDPPDLLRALTERLELPLAWPWTRFPSFTSGAANLGINIEAVRYAPGRPSPVHEDAGLYAIACEPAPMAGARAELARRGIPHSPPVRYTGRYPDEANTPVFHRRSGESGALWTIVVIGGMIGDESSARRFSRGLERGDSRLAPVVGRLGGKVASGRLAAHAAAGAISKRPFIFLCEYHDFNVPEGHAAALADLGSRGGGPLGLLRTHELVIGVRDASAEAGRWQTLLDPLEPTEPGRWQPGDGPAIRVVEGGEDAIARMVWEVGSLSKAADWLGEQGWLGSEQDGELGIAPAALQGVDVRLREPAAG